MVSNNFVYRSNVAVAPGETLLEVLHFMKMTQKELAERMGRPLKLVNEIVKGKASITTETAIQLERVLGPGKEASFWLNLEAGYQEALAREAERTELDAELEAASLYPYKEMVKNGWLVDAPTELDKTQNILSFFGVNSLENVFERRVSEPVAYRISTKKKVDQYALEAWLRKGTIDAQETEIPSFNKEILESKVPILKALNTKMPQEFLPEIEKHLKEAGVFFVLTRNLPNVPVNGASRWLGGDKALIQLSNYGKKSDKFWFSLFHEIGHILLHGKKLASLNLGEASMADIHEVEANDYSRNVLISSKDFQSFLSKKDFSDESIKAFANKMGVLPGIVVGRLQYEEILGFNQKTHLFSSYVWKD